MRLTIAIGNSRKSLTKHLRRTFWLYKGIGMLKLEEIHRQTGETYVDLLQCLDKWERSQTSRICNLYQPSTDNTLGPNKPSRRWTWHSLHRKHHNQIDYVLVRKRFQSGVNVHRTRSFPGADTGSDHGLVMMTFRVRLKKAKKSSQSRLRFDLEKFRNPDVAGTFQATIGGKFAPLINHSWRRRSDRIQKS